MAAAVPAKAVSLSHPYDGRIVYMCALYIRRYLSWIRKECAKGYAYRSAADRD